MVVSKLPAVKKTIFSQMSALAAEHDAINLSQGFPNFDCDPYLKEQVIQSMQRGDNQYAPMPGVPELQQSIGRLVKDHYHAHINPVDQVTVTSGATEALFVAIQTVVRAGDDVIVFDPAYDSYEPAVDLAGGNALTIICAVLCDQLQQVNTITSNNRHIINSPHNPTDNIGGNDMAQKIGESLQFVCDFR